MFMECFQYLVLYILLKMLNRHPRTFHQTFHSTISLCYLLLLIHVFLGADYVVYAKEKVFCSIYLWNQ